ncbi:hypothetical protein SBI_02437 [Streptomyces bingchenggensis BCW-1]|uniref:Uncharacterized protein n=1 Tax=Streptomyces bingchenggensis (strain BCW-1) TaxID=749414 RepID=D7BX13_STRBB|nr:MULTISPECIES: hypothetical protein [Streptomyces]ADI05558.1 hypothetical protein SBI_02437 [Streptomyces bingchenggensis BCW-1]
MTQPSPPEPSVAVELEKLRGTMAEGFARVDGSLALLVQRGVQTDRALADLDDRVDSLERGRWPLPSVAALVGALGLILSAWQLAAR